MLLLHWATLAIPLVSARFDLPASFLVGPPPTKAQPPYDLGLLASDATAVRGVGHPTSHRLRGAALPATARPRPTSAPARRDSDSWHVWRTADKLEREGLSVGSRGGGGGGGDVDGAVQTMNFAYCGEVCIRERLDRLEVGDGKKGAEARSDNRGGEIVRTGTALWSASLALSDYIDDRCGSGAWGSETLTCVELGAGLGLPSIVAARHGFRAVSTDGDPSVLSLLEENLRSNLPEGSTMGAGGEDGQQVHVELLDWSDFDSSKREQDSDRHPVLAHLEECGGRGADLIILSDVVYGATRAGWGPLLRTVNGLRDHRRRRRLLASESEVPPGRASRILLDDGTVAPCGDSKDPLVLLGYTQRRRDMSAEEEGLFFAMVKRAGMEARPIPSRLVPHSDERILTTVFELRWREG